MQNVSWKIIPFNISLRDTSIAARVGFKSNAHSAIHGKVGIWDSTWRVITGTVGGVNGTVQ